MPSHALRWSRWCLGFPRQVSSLTWKWEIHRWVGWNHHRWGRPALNLVDGSEMVQIDQTWETWKKLEPYESRILGIRIYIYIIHIYIYMCSMVCGLTWRKSWLHYSDPHWNLPLSLSPLAGSLWVTGTGPFRMHSAPKFKPLPHSLWLNSPLPPIWRCPIHGGTPKSSILFLDFPTEKPSSKLEVPPWPWKPPRWWRL